MSRPALRPWTSAPLSISGEKVLVAPEHLKAWGCDGLELQRRQLSAMPAAGRHTLQRSLRQAGLPVAFVTASDEAGRGWELEALRETLQLADFFEAECAVTSAPPRGPAGGVDEGEAAEWLRDAATLAEASAIPLLVENRPGTWGGTGRGFEQLLGQVDSPWLQAAFDPAGFAAIREHPFLTAFLPSHLKARIQMLRIRDATFEDGSLVTINDGNAEIAELVSAMLARGFAGFFAVGTPQAGPEQIKADLAEFQRLLATLGLTMHQA